MTVGFKIVEGISGYYSYHLVRSKDGVARALCGARTMHTSIPLDQWGSKFEIGCLSAKWCERCREIADGIEQASDTEHGD